MVFSFWLAYCAMDAQDKKGCGKIGGTSSQISSDSVCRSHLASTNGAEMTLHCPFCGTKRVVVVQTCGNKSQRHLVCDTCDMSDGFIYAQRMDSTRAALLLLGPSILHCAGCGNQEIEYTDATMLKCPGCGEVCPVVKRW